MKITIKIGDKEVELTPQEARELFDELSVLFKNEDPNIPRLPYFPPATPWTPYRWEWDGPITWETQCGER